MSKILITGGLGFIGSIVSKKILEQTNYNLILVDNLSNSREEVLKVLTSKYESRVSYYNIDLRDLSNMKLLFKLRGPFDAIIHFAALKSVKESTLDPLLYYDNNICGMIYLCQLADEFNCNSLLFSSSACIYGDNPVPYLEDQKPNPLNPYGKTKYFGEEILSDLCKYRKWKGISLRYFNPIGSDSEHLLGDLPNKEPENLMPYLTSVAYGDRDCLNLYGSDYEESKDGTAIRDYLHVEDLAQGHIISLEYLLSELPESNYEVFNLGSGDGYTVREMINAMEEVIGKEICVKIQERRDGDVPKSLADVSKAYHLLNWKTTKSLKEMCKDSWMFYIKNRK